MRILKILLLVIVAVNLQAQTKSNLELIDIFNYEYVSDPQISPDGSKIVYVRNFKDVMTDRNLSNLWIIDFDGQNNRPLTTGNNNDYDPRWSNDGTRITYKSNKEDDKMKLYLMWVDTRESFALTNTSSAPSNVAWSRDDEYLAFTMFVPGTSESIVKMPSKPEGASWNAPPTYIDKMNYRGDGAGYYKPGNTQIFILSTEGGTPMQVSKGDKNHGSPEWSEDGGKLYFSADLEDDEEWQPADSEIYELDLNTREVKALTSRFGPDYSPKVSPDGKMIAFLGNDDTYQGHTNTELYVMDIDGSDSRMISQQLDRDIENINWAPDNQGLYFQYTDHGDSKLSHMSLSGNVTAVTGNIGGLSLGRPYNAADYSVSKNGRFAFPLASTSHPADLASHVTGNTKRLTHLNDDLFGFRKLGNVEEMNWKSSYDGLDIQGWLVTPPDFDSSKKYPLILEIHGGPFASYGSVYSAEIQAFAAAGYVVLYTNPRGSTGYGQEFANSIHHDYPNHDYEDLMSGVDAAIEKGFIDENNLFVTGGSGGGVLTAWIVGKTNRFRAAVVAKPVINWYSFVLYADAPNFFYRYWFPNKPWEDPEPYLRRSPLSYVGNIETPTMLLTGEEDYRTPIAESEQFYAALKIEGVESAMVRIPGASHGIANKPSNLIAKIAAILAWFDKYKQVDEVK
ncbi:S9 family peptidase [Portibacter marinus]|uniref:S9 family peptidase n=1 Tax=Portibacter marinus TaxID=2898660 RepID=UPI001F3CFBA4|nr:S9 family peptidase [Portibacter marinus]